MEASEIIVRLGGPKKVGEKLGVPPSTVANWPWRKTIPGRYWPAILRLARDEGVDLMAAE